MSAVPRSTGIEPDLVTPTRHLLVQKHGHFPSEQIKDREVHVPFGLYPEPDARRRIEGIGEVLVEAREGRKEIPPGDIILTIDAETGSCRKPHM